MTVSVILGEKGSNVFTILPSAGIEQAAKILRDRKCGALVVADKAGTMVGIVSERDIVRTIGDMGAKGLMLCIQDIMTRSVHTCQSNDSVAVMMQLMTKYRIRHVPIIDNGKLTGLVSQTDLIKHQLAEQDNQVRAMKNLNIAKK
ncbi:MAG: CBS domain-containing protein [Rhodospirillaceae bacterium]